MTLILVLLSSVAFFMAAAAMLLCGPRRFMRGRHLSRPLVRRVGLTWALATRHVLVFGAIPFSIAGRLVPYVILTVAYTAWAVDDWLFSDDDEKKRRHEWAKVRLRMPKPIKLRQVERWAPA